MLRKSTYTLSRVSVSVLPRSPAPHLLPLSRAWEKGLGGEGSHINLPRHRRRDQRRAVLAQPLDELLRFGDQGVDAGGFVVEVGNYLLLFFYGRNRD